MIEGDRVSIQTSTYDTRVIAKSQLSPQALLVALVISRLRYQKRLKHHEPLPLTLAELADACHMSRASVVRYLDECIASGWVRGRRVFRDGRQQANRYYICDPTDETESRRLDSVIASESGPESQLLSPGVRHIVRRRLDTVRRSTYNGAGDDAAPRGGGGSDEQGAKSDGRQPSPTPALEGAGDDTGHGGETRNPQLEKAKKEPSDAMYAQWEAERIEREIAELAAGHTGHVVPKRHDPLAIACPEPDCPAKAGEPCPGYKLKGVPHSKRRMTAYWQEIPA